jgi:hypothetical protein
VDVKQAVKIAKEYVLEIFGPEGATNIGLEEVEFLESEETWLVTIGFSRPWDKSNNPIFNAVNQDRPLRTYKLLRIDNLEKCVVSVKNRETKS